MSKRRKLFKLKKIYKEKNMNNKKDYVCPKLSMKYLYSLDILLSSTAIDAEPDPFDTVGNPW